MQPSTSRAVKALASKLHPQLPLNKRESNQLLAALTESFQHQLDLEHPTKPPSKSRSRPRSRSSLNSKGFAPTSLDAGHLSSITSTVHHLDSVLTNPLFTESRRSRRDSISDTQQLMTDPLGWFKSHIANGTATVNKARICVDQILKLHASETSNGRRSALYKLQAGSQIYSWLWSCNLHASAEFIRCETLAEKLGIFLSAEDQSRILWRILNQSEHEILEATSVNQPEITHWKSSLFLGFMKAEKVGGVPKGMQLILDALEEVSLPIHLLQQIIEPAASHVLHRLKLRIQSPQDANFGTSISEVYDKLIEKAPAWTGYWELYQAFLAVHHPTKPDSSLGLAYLEKCSVEEQQDDSAWRVSMIQLTNALTIKLINDGDYATAQQTLEFTRNLLPPSANATDRVPFEHFAKITPQLPSILKSIMQELTDIRDIRDKERSLYIVQKYFSFLSKPLSRGNESAAPHAILSS